MNDKKSLVRVSTHALEIFAWNSLCQFIDTDFESQFVFTRVK